MPQKVVLGILEQKNFFCHPHGGQYLRSALRLFLLGKTHKSFWKVKSNPEYLQSQNQDVYGFSLYTGKTAEVQKDLSGTNVRSLTMNLLNQGYRLYLDNYYTKAELFLYFYDNKTYATGTTRADQGFMQAILMSITQYKKLNLSIFLNLNIYFCLLVCLFWLLVFCFWY